MAREAQHLDRQHREHARHQVEQQAAEQGAEQRGEEAGGGRRQRRGEVGRERRLQGGGDGGWRRRGRPRAADRGDGAPGDGGAVAAVGLGQRHHDRHLGGAGAAVVGQWHGRAPASAVPRLLRRRGGADHVGGLEKEFERAAARRRRQVVELHAQRGAVDLDAARRGQRHRLRGPRGLEGAGVQRGRAAHRQPQREFAFLGNAFLAADQPGGLQAEVDRRRAGERGRGREVRRHGQRHRQQHRALVAVVGQRADRDLPGHRPGDVARRDAGRQGPGQLGGQAGIAGVLPVGVPAGLMDDAQADLQRRAGRDAVGRLGDQFGAHVRRRHHRRGRRGARGQGELRRDRHRAAQGEHERDQDGGERAGEAVAWHAGIRSKGRPDGSGVPERAAGPRGRW